MADEIRELLDRHSQANQRDNGQGVMPATAFKFESEAKRPGGSRPANSGVRNMPEDPLGLNYDDFTRMVLALRTLHNEISGFWAGYGPSPAPGSLADMETQSYADPDLAQTPYSLVSMLINIATDQLSALIKTLTEPVQTIAPWTCTRSLLEACALAAWMLDPGLDVNARVRRSFAHRYEGLDQQLRLMRATDASRTGGIESRINAVECKALARGFAPVNDRSGRRCGIGQRMPSATELLRDVLGEEKAYRILSAVAHGHNWATSQLGFNLVERDGMTLPETHLHVSAVMYLCLRAMPAYARPNWYFCRLYGRNVNSVEGIFDKAFDQVGIKQELRFWRTP